MDNPAGAVPDQHRCRMHPAVGRDEIEAMGHGEFEIVSEFGLGRGILDHAPVPRQVGDLFAMPACPDQPRPRGQFVCDTAMKRMEGMDIDDRRDSGAIVCQPQEAVAVLARHRIAVEQEEPAIRAADQRHLGTDVDHLRELEASTKIPHIVMQLLHSRRCSRARSRPAYLL